MSDPIREARPADRPRLRAIQTVVLAEPWPELLALGVDGPPLCLVYADPDPTGYAEGYRGEGRGTKLLIALVDRLRERAVSVLRVTVRTVDEDAQSFYEERGFSVESRLPDHYENCDGLSLTREC